MEIVKKNILSVICGVIALIALIALFWPIGGMYSDDQVKLDAPEIAENGGVVPISVTTTLADVTSIAFLVSENPNALAASYQIPAGTVPAVANRLKMAKTTNVIVIVEAGGKLYSATKEVKVTVGGCGG